MKYMGSKHKLMRKIIPYLSPFLHLPKYIEPFVGGANAIVQVPHPNRIGYDILKDLIYMYTRIQEGWNPPEHISEETYDRCKCNTPDISTELRMFACINYAFNGKLFDSYTADESTGSKLIYKQIPSIREEGLTFLHSDYRSIDISDAIVYADPPYTGASPAYCKGFDNDEFNQWVIDNKNVSPIIISEAIDIPGFRTIWNETRNTGCAIHSHSKQLREVLLVPKDGISDIDYARWFEDEFQECLEPLEEYRL